MVFIYCMISFNVCQEYLSEASLCQDEMEIIMETSSRMIPSLDATDKTTLEKSLKNIKGRQESVMSALQDLQDKMEARIDQWNEFHVSNQYENSRFNHDE